MWRFRRGTVEFSMLRSLRRLAGKASLGEPPAPPRLAALPHAQSFGGGAWGGAALLVLQPLLCSDPFPDLGAFQTGHPAPDLLTLTTSHVLRVTREHPDPPAGAELLPKHRLPSPT